MGGKRNQIGPYNLPQAEDLGPPPLLPRPLPLRIHPPHVGKAPLWGLSLQVLTFYCTITSAQTQQWELDASLQHSKGGSCPFNRKVLRSGMKADETVVCGELHFLAPWRASAKESAGLPA